MDQVLNGPSDDPFGSLNLVGGLRRSMAKSGYCDLNGIPEGRPDRRKLTSICFLTTGSKYILVRWNLTTTS